jgi:hypothetical protein
LSELVTRVRGGTLQRPALIDATSERLLQVLVRGLSAAPGARFTDVSELLLALERADSPPRRGRTLALSALLLATFAAFFWWRSGVESRAVAPPPSAEAARSVPLAAPTTEASAVSVVPPAVSSVLPSSSPRPAAASSAAAPVDKHRPPKPTDVRYKDWLKDPF